MKKLPKLLRDELTKYGKALADTETSEEEIVSKFPNAAVEIIYNFAKEEALEELKKENKTKLEDFKVSLKQLKTSYDHVHVAVRELMK